MRKITARHLVVTIGTLSLLGCFGGGGSCTGDEEISVTPIVNEFLPCRAAVGEDIVILGSKFFSKQGSGYVRIGGQVATVKSWSTGRIVATVPAGAVDGPVTVTNSDSIASRAGEDLQIGARTPVAETEPNDSINGSDATDTGRNQAGTGDLMTLSDKDHFLFNCIHPRTYKIKVTPRVVGTVYVNGTGVNLDGNGECSVDGHTAVGEKLLVGLTGGTGTYTISITAFPAP